MSNNLHVWTADDEEWVVATSPEDACAVYCAFIGCEPSKVTDPDDLDGTHPSDWTQVPDDKVFKLAEECPEHHPKGVACPRACGDDHMIRLHITCAEHVARSGRGYLGSANY